MLRWLVSIAIAFSPTLAFAQGESNFSMAGFPADIQNEQTFIESLSSYLDKCEIIELDEDDRLCFVQNEIGGQLRIGFREANGALTFVTANPAYIGKSNFSVEVEGLQSDKDWEPYEIRLSVTFSDMEIPLLIELADPRDAHKFQNLSESKTLTVDLTAFAFEPQLFESVEAFKNGQNQFGEDISLAPNFFIPSGMFGDEPSARAYFAGEVIEAELVTAESGTRNWRTLVKVLGDGTINLIFPEGAITTTPQPGQLLVAEAWLSAQLR